METAPRLIILRGNSGSGKTTVAKRIRDEIAKNNKAALIEQDYLRRIVLKEKEKDDGDNITLIKNTVEFALDRSYDVVLEGIFFSGRYKQILLELLKKTPNNFVYYFDVSFEETLKRHSTKINSNEFGEKEMKSWFREKDFLDLPNEKIIPESNSLQDTVDQILRDIR